jgi:hypothetical protein
MILSVPDRRCRIYLEVALVRRWAIGVLGIWRGEGLGKGWDRGGQFTSNLRPRWTDPLTARVRKGNKGESARGEKSKGNAPWIL